MTSMQVSPASLRQAAGVLARAATDLTSARTQLRSQLQAALPRVAVADMRACAEQAEAALDVCARLAGAAADLAHALGWLADRYDELERGLAARLTPTPEGRGPHASGG